MKKSIFDEQTAKALKNWRMAAVKKKRGGGAGSVGGNSPRTLGNLTSSPTAASSVTPLNRFKTFGHSPRSQGYEETPFSDLEAEPQSSATHTINVQVDHQNDSKTESSIPLQQYDKNNNTEDFSFDKHAPSSK